MTNEPMKIAVSLQCKTSKVRKRTSGLLPLLKKTWINDANDDKTSNDKGQSHKGDEEDTASTGRKFPSDYPILDVFVSFE